MKREFRSTALDVAVILFSCVLLMVVAAGAIDRQGVSSRYVSPPHILVDAGHGGADGGAEGADGTLEKELNLAVSMTLADLLRICGFRVSQTRTEDRMVNTEGTSLRERKVSDMKVRLALAEQADLTVSIHQNKFPQARYFGTQVFYGGGNEQSRLFAEAIRTSVVSLLQPDNTRELKRGDSSVYLLHRATKPIVLVECGFLSNEEELTKLKTPAYRAQMALAIAGGIVSGQMSNEGE